MSSPSSPTRRRPVPPPKTESEEQLRADLTSPGRQAKGASSQHEQLTRAQSDTCDPEAQKREAMKHLRLPPGWDLRNEVDVTYHTHVAKPVVHETVHHVVTEIIEPKITRDIHHYHQYDYIQPLEVEIPENSYATNATGEVIHAPGGLGTKIQSGASSHWEQERQDRGYGLVGSWKQEKDHKGTADAEEGRRRTGSWEGRDRTDGPFLIQAEGGGEGVLGSIRSGSLAQRFGGSLTSSGKPASHPNPISDQSHTSQTPQRRDGADAWASDLEKDLKHLSLGQSPTSEAKPLPALPDTSPGPPQSNIGVRRVSSDNKLRNRYSADSDRRPVQQPTTDTEAGPDGTSGASNARMS